jgi:hypothetical protein
MICSYSWSKSRLRCSQEHIILQSLVEALNDSNSAFAKLLCHSVGKRIIERRQRASKLRRYLEDLCAVSDFDNLLARVSQEQVVLLERSSVVKELARFNRDEAGGECRHFSKQQRQLNAAKLRFETLVEEKSRSRKEHHENAVESAETSSTLSERRAERVLDAFERGKSDHVQDSDSPLRALLCTLDCILPASVPSERAFSRARKVRQYSRERLTNDRFQRIIVGACCVITR